MLVKAVMESAIAHEGAERGVLVVPAPGEGVVEAAASRAGTMTVRVQAGAATSADLPTSVLERVLRTKEAVIVDDASADPHLSADAYVVRSMARSIVALPLLREGTVTGCLYLENNRA